MSWFWSSKEEKPKDKFDEIKITVPKRDELKKVNLDTGLVLPKKPGFNNKPKQKTDEKAEHEQNLLDGKVAFDINKEYDLKTYSGRFQKQFNSVNPLLFFVPTKEILKARDEVFKYRMRLEAAQNMGSQVYLTPEEITKLKR